MAQASKREKILETAGILFMNQGFQSVSMDQIAGAVPVSKPTLYAHFKDKRDLFVAVINERCAVFISTLKAAIENGKTPEESLYNFAREFLDMTLTTESLQFHRTIIGESVTFPEMAQLFYETGPSQVRAVLMAYLDTLNKQKLMKISDTSLASDIFLSMAKGHTHLKCLLGITKKVSAKERDRIAHEVARFFIQGYSV